MDFTLSNDHVALRDVAQAFLDAEVNLAPLLVPGSKAGPSRPTTRLWTKIAELGWPSLIIPEAYGGLGMSYIDLVDDRWRDGPHAGARAVLRHARWNLGDPQGGFRGAEVAVLGRVVAGGVQTGAGGRRREWQLSGHRRNRRP